MAVAQRRAVQQADATTVQRRGTRSLRRRERRGLRVRLQHLLHAGIGAQRVVQLHCIHVDTLACGIDQAGAFIGVGAERVFDGGHAQAVMFMPGGHVGQFATGGQLFGGGDRIGTGAAGAHRITQAIAGGRAVALAAGVEVTIPDNSLAPAQLAINGRLVGAGGVILGRRAAGFR
ncbi:hypothetical protein D3C73_984170 [compost metagenome]